jgi:hypothetical protein
LFGLVAVLVPPADAPWRLRVQVRSYAGSTVTKQRFGVPHAHRLNIEAAISAASDHMYEVDRGETLTIWGGGRGSPAYCQGMFSADGTTCSGAWAYPGGGG